MRLPENKFLASAVLFVPPSSLTLLIASLRWDIFFYALGMSSFWFSLQVAWSLYCRGSTQEAIREENEELFL